eukprot:TRINITY_DN5467_c0_g1_i8.p1 TRINITY_DN5467_c0_g1~~TRINITY_DN5467_c0_g1_i8.p1  ORF type:complete len:1006 (+),score=166.18 TRINITY_DN5467_c0_g1_i8:180-3197(+)
MCIRDSSSASQRSGTPQQQGGGGMGPVGTLSNASLGGIEDFLGASGGGRTPGGSHYTPSCNFRKASQDSSSYSTAQLSNNNSCLHTLVPPTLGGGGAGGVRAASQPHSRMPIPVPSSQLQGGGTDQDSNLMAGFGSVDSVQSRRLTPRGGGGARGTHQLGRGSAMTSGQSTPGLGATQNSSSDRRDEDDMVGGIGGTSGGGVLELRTSDSGASYPSNFMESSSVTNSTPIQGDYNVPPLYHAGILAPHGSHADPLVTSHLVPTVVTSTTPTGGDGGGSVSTTLDSYYNNIPSPQSTFLGGGDGRRRSLGSGGSVNEEDLLSPRPSSSRGSSGSSTSSRSSVLSIGAVLNVVAASTANGGGGTSSGTTVMGSGSGQLSTIPHVTDLGGLSSTAMRVDDFLTNTSDINGGDSGINSPTGILPNVVAMGSHLHRPFESSFMHLSQHSPDILSSAVFSNSMNSGGVGVSTTAIGGGGMPPAVQFVTDADDNNNGVSGGGGVFNTISTPVSSTTPVLFMGNSSWGNSMPHMGDGQETAEGGGPTPSSPLSPQPGAPAPGTTSTLTTAAASSSTNNTTRVSASPQLRRESIESGSFRNPTPLSTVAVTVDEDGDFFDTLSSVSSSSSRDEHTQGSVSHTPSKLSAMCRSPSTKGRQDSASLYAVASTARMLSTRDHSRSGGNGNTTDRHRRTHRHHRRRNNNLHADDNGDDMGTGGSSTPSRMHTPYVGAELLPFGPLNTGSIIEEVDRSAAPTANAAFSKNSFGSAPSPLNDTTTTNSRVVRRRPQAETVNNHTPPPSTENSVRDDSNAKPTPTKNTFTLGTATMMTSPSKTTPTNQHTTTTQFMGSSTSGGGTPDTADTTTPKGVHSDKAFLLQPPSSTTMGPSRSPPSAPIAVLDPSTEAAASMSAPPPQSGLKQRASSVRWDPAADDNSQRPKPLRTSGNSSPVMSSSLKRAGSTVKSSSSSLPHGKQQSSSINSPSSQHASSPTKPQQQQQQPIHVEPHPSQQPQP